MALEKTHVSSPSSETSCVASTRLKDRDKLSKRSYSHKATHSTCPSVASCVRFVVGIFLPKLWLGQTGITLGFELQVQYLLLRCLSSCANSKTLDSQTKSMSAQDNALPTNGHTHGGPRYPRASRWSRVYRRRSQRRYGERLRASHRDRLACAGRG